MIVYIFGFSQGNKFVPESLFGSLQESTETLEYCDLQQENYEVWEYPSGKIYSIQADRDLGEQSKPLMPGEDSWLPIFKIKETDIELVSRLYEAIKANPKMLKRVSMRWIRPWETFFYRRSSIKKFLE